jgi:hypothetical protein
MGCHCEREMFANNTKRTARHQCQSMLTTNGKRSNTSTCARIDQGHHHAIDEWCGIRVEEDRRARLPPTRLTATLTSEFDRTAQLSREGQRIDNLNGGFLLRGRPEQLKFWQS